MTINSIVKFEFLCTVFVSFTVPDERRAVVVFSTTLHLNRSTGGVGLSTKIIYRLVSDQIFLLFYVLDPLQPDLLLIQRYEDFRLEHPIP